MRFLRAGRGVQAPTSQHVRVFVAERVARNQVTLLNSHTKKVMGMET